MTRIALITLHTPTPNNFRAASALPYHLSAFRPKNTELEIWSFNLNGCSAEQIEKTERELGSKIHLLPRGRKMSFCSLAPARLLLKKPLLAYLTLKPEAQAEISSYLSRKKSALWIYGEDIAGLTHLFDNQPTVITTPDCEAMYYHRVLAMSGIPSNKLSLARYTLMYHRYARFTATYPTGSHIKYHLVGKADRNFLKMLNPAADAYFIRHPHYDITQLQRSYASDGKPIRLLLAGRYDFYMSRAVDEAISAMTRLPRSVKEKYHITFLGKGWEKSRNQLTEAGYTTDLKTFVDDYATEISTHHIQLTPVAVGTGTKGKVLDAFANGLMVIGTPLALENIAAESGKECVEYKSADELTEWLENLADKPLLINEIAKAGMEAVLRSHGREKIAEEFFSLFE